MRGPPSYPAAVGWSPPRSTTTASRACCSTAASWTARGCWDGRKTVELMTANHLPDGQDIASLALPGMFTAVPYTGMGFGLGFSVVQSPARAQTPGSPGAYAWAGAAGTVFLNDPVEDLGVIFMTQIMLASTYPLG